MTVYDPKNVVVDVLLTLQRHKIPVSLLDDVLADIRSAVMSQPIRAESVIGLSITDYEKEGKRILQEIEELRRKGDTT